MAKNAKQEAPQDAEATPEVVAVELCGKTFRARAPLEWSPGEADAAVAIAGRNMGILINASEDESEEQQRERGMLMMQPLFESGKYREFLALGLWEEGRAVNDENLAAHTTFFKEKVFPFSEINKGISVATAAFFG